MPSVRINDVMRMPGSRISNPSAVVTLPFFELMKTAIFRKRDESSAAPFKHAPFCCIINDIIVYQSSCVKQFNQGCTPEGRFTDLSTGPGAQENEHRTHLLALSLDDVVHDFIEQKYLSMHGSTELLFKFFHLSGNGCFYIFEA